MGHTISPLALLCPVKEAINCFNLSFFLLLTVLYFLLSVALSCTAPCHLCGKWQGAAPCNKTEGGRKEGKELKEKGKERKILIGEKPMSRQIIAEVGEIEMDTKRCGTVSWSYQSHGSDPFSVLGSKDQHISTGADT